MPSDERVLASWTEMPYTSYDKRGWTIEHRVVVEHYGAMGSDVRHEVRSSDSDDCPDEWTELDIAELRDHGMFVRKRDGDWP